MFSPHSSFLSQSALLLKSIVSMDLCQCLLMTRDKCQAVQICPTGLSSATGANPFGLLQVDYFEGHEPVQVQTYTTPEKANLLHLQLWGAGGEGGGAGSIPSRPPLATAGGGGGAGGYAEAYIHNPSETYNFLLQVGGLGGEGQANGEDALPSYFASPSEMQAKVGIS